MRPLPKLWRRREEDVGQVLGKKRQAGGCFLVDLHEPAEGKKIAEVEVGPGTR